MADTPDLNQISNLTTAQRQGTQALLGGQRAETADFLNRYKTTIGGQETTSAMAKRIGEELNLPTLRENAYSLQSTLRNIPQTFSAATRGFDVNANQMARIIGQKQSEIAPSAEEATQAVQRGENTLSTLLGYGQADQAKELLPFQTEQSLLTERLARESSMYSQDNQRELDALISKVQAGITLSEGEKNRAQSLAIAEMNYNLSKQELDAGMSKGQIETIGGNKYLVNPYTGEKKLLGSASSGTGGVSSAQVNSYYTKPTTTASTTTTPTTTAPSVVGYNPFGFTTQEALDAYNASQIQKSITNPTNIQIGNMGLSTPQKNNSLLYLLGK